MKWIKASEKLPPMETPLVLKHEDGKIMLGNFYEDDQSYRIYFQRGGTYEEYSISYHAKVNIWWLDDSEPKPIVPQTNKKLFKIIGGCE